VKLNKEGWKSHKLPSLDPQTGCTDSHLQSHSHYPYLSIHTSIHSFVDSCLDFSGGAHLVMAAWGGISKALNKKKEIHGTILSTHLLSDINNVLDIVDNRDGKKPARPIPKS